MIRSVVGPDALREHFRVVVDIETDPREAGRAAIANLHFVIGIHAEIGSRLRLAQTAVIARTDAVERQRRE